MRDNVNWRADAQRLREPEPDLPTSGVVPGQELFQIEDDSGAVLARISVNGAEFWLG